MTFPEREGIRPLPVQLHDFTGTVTAVEVAADAGVWTASNEGVEPVNGQPSSLVLYWLGGACDDHVDIAVRRDPRTNIEVHTAERFGSCTAAGVPRRLLLTFVLPVDPTDFSVTDTR